MVCTECQAALVVTLDPSLSMRAVESLSRVYKTRFATSHASDCSFRSGSERLLLSHPAKLNDGNKGTFLVPLYFASVLPQCTVDLLEQSNPRNMLQRNTKELLEHLPTSNELQLPSLILSRDVQCFASSGGSVETEEQEETLVKCISDALKEPGFGDIKYGNFTRAAIFTLFGWLPVPCTFDNSASNSLPTLAVKCPICLARINLKLETIQAARRAEATPTNCSQILMESGSSDNSYHEGDSVEEINQTMRPAKRLRVMLDSIQNTKGVDPLSSHRHYCPFVCGFQFDPTQVATPLWQVIASSLLRQSKSTCKGNTVASAPGAPVDNEKLKDADHLKTGKEALDEVRKILRSGIV